MEILTTFLAACAGGVVAGCVGAAIVCRYWRLVLSKQHDWADAAVQCFSKAPDVIDSFTKALHMGVELIGMAASRLPGRKEVAVTMTHRREGGQNKVSKDEHTINGKPKLIRSGRQSQVDDYVGDERDFTL